jgi:heme-degrading monooxygenase HmoA
MKSMKILAVALALTAATPLFAQTTNTTNKTEASMKMVLIDKLTVPALARERFIERMNANREIIQKMDGFEGDEVCVRTDENGNSIFVTIATWKDETHLKEAKIKVDAEYKRTGFDVREFTMKYNIVLERDIYHVSGN